MLARMQRLLRHRWQADVHQTLPPALLQRLTRGVSASERQHSGEIRIYAEAGLPLSYLWRRQTTDELVRERALTIFGKLRVWDTEHNNGVLIYLMLAERRIEIVADRGLNDKVPRATWHTILARMREPFKAGDFETGLTLALHEVDGLLRAHFPQAPGSRNPDELPDAPVLG